MYYDGGGSTFWYCLKLLECSFWKSGLFFLIKQQHVELKIDLYHNPNTWLDDGSQNVVKNKFILLYLYA